MLQVTEHCQLSVTYFPADGGVKRSWKNWPMELTQAAKFCRRVLGMGTIEGSGLKDGVTNGVTLGVGVAIGLGEGLGVEVKTGFDVHFCQTK